MIYNTFREKFKDRQATSDERVNHGSKMAWEAAMPDQAPIEFVDAAVLVPIFQGPQELEVLLTQRALHLTHHPGQVSFPGGRREPDDQSLEATALRETFEETGIHPDNVEIIGHLPRMYTISYYDVDPVVGIVHPGFELRPDKSEVEAIFSVPLSYFMDTKHQQVVTREFHGKHIPMTEFNFNDQRIWGATAAMVLSLVDILWNS